MAGDRWYISGYDGLRQFFGKAIPADDLDEGRIKELLALLYSKFLTAEEVVGSFWSPAGEYGHLTVEQNTGGSRGGFMIGSDPHFTAFLVPADEELPRSSITGAAPSAAPWEYS